jgi:hypothetical protein
MRTYHFWKLAQVDKEVGESMGNDKPSNASFYRTQTIQTTELLT